MRQAERKKEKDKIAITLMLCFCVIALTSIFAVRSNINKINNSGGGVPVSDPAPSEEPAGNPDSDSETVSKPEIVERSSVNVPAVDSLGENSQTDSGSSNKPQSQNSRPLTSPVKASDSRVTNEYSMDALIYSVTLDQYMTHCGVDIEADADTQVLSMADGTVTAVYVDDRYGNSVEITHDNQFIAIYSNLSDANMMEIGDRVTSGQIIGGVGTTGLFESLEPAHLHLELLRDGVYVNPMDYISF